MNRFFQYAFWPNCNNRCPFCINRGKKWLNSMQMIQTINDLSQFLDIDAQDNDVIDLSFIGGEFFDDQLNDIDVKNSFISLLDKCAYYHKTGKISRMMICTSLIFDIHKHLTPILEYLESNGLLDCLMLCTSYDTIYRFHSDDDIRLWKANMEELSKIVKCIVHTEIILTKDAIRKIIEDEFDLLQFEKDNHTRIDFIEPTYIQYYNGKDNTIEDIPEFFPKRQDFLQLVQKKCIEQHIIGLEPFLSLKLRSRSVRFKNWNDNKWYFIKDRWSDDCRRYDEFGNTVKIYTYSDSDGSMSDDLEVIKRSLCQ